ncbi:MAG: hypothetical protein AAB325_12650, partial [Pseudomonadota bacterium]
MIEGARWKKWLWFYLPMGMFILALLFPFYWMLVTTVRPDSELYRPWNHPLYMPFWTTQPTLEHVKNLLYETLFAAGLASRPASVARGDGLSLRNCRITNAVKCLPPENKPGTAE